MSSYIPDIIKETSGGNIHYLFAAADNKISRGTLLRNTIQEACEEGDVYLKLAAKDFMIPDTISVHGSGITIVGEGYNTEIDGSGNAVFYCKAAVGGAASGIHFSDFRISNTSLGFYIGATSNDKPLFDFSFENIDLSTEISIGSPKGWSIIGYPATSFPSTSEVSDIRINNCKVHGFHTGLSVTRAQRISIINTDFYNNSSVGLNFSNDGVGGNSPNDAFNNPAIVDGCKFYNNAYAGFYSWGTWDLHVTNCIAENNGWTGFNISCPRGATFTNNITRNNHTLNRGGSFVNTGLYCHLGDVDQEDQDIASITIANNIFDNECVGVLMDGGSHDLYQISVMDNMFTSMATGLFRLTSSLGYDYGVGIHFSAFRSGHGNGLIIANNVINGGAVDECDLKAGVIVEMRTSNDINADNVCIKGNLISNVQDGIIVDEEEGIVITSNIITNCWPNAGDGRAITLNDSLGDEYGHPAVVMLYGTRITKVIDNNLVNYLTSGIEITGADTSGSPVIEFNNFTAGTLYGGNALVRGDTQTYNLNIVRYNRGDLITEQKGLIQMPKNETENVGPFVAINGVEPTIFNATSQFTIGVDVGKYMVVPSGDSFVQAKYENSYAGATSVWWSSVLHSFILDESTTTIG